MSVNYVSLAFFFFTIRELCIHTDMSAGDFVCFANYYWEGCCGGGGSSLYAEHCLSLRGFILVWLKLIVFPKILIMNKVLLGKLD